MSAESELKRHRDEAVRIRSQISNASGTVASKRKKSADARTAATRAKVESTIRAKLREADAAERDANTAERRRADLEKKLAQIEKKIAATQGRYEKDQQATQKRALDLIRKQNAASAQQFSPPRRLGEVPSGRLTPDRESGARVVTGLPPPQTPSPVNDVFLSHASEDKDDIARPLKNALESRGVSVWFDEIKIKVGQSIRQEIEKGITHARFGVVILSPDFFAKQWTQAELDALFSKKAASGESLILPIWYRVTKDEVMSESPLLAGILALNASLMTIDEMANAIAGVVRP